MKIKILYYFKHDAKAKVKMSRRIKEKRDEEVTLNVKVT